ncbi:hypothetical protein J8L98_12550 [Pseudoalteromonas sp. MMG013]|uniref:hypothetical protein n=1 Tax=Pseudoalteromonas sp. MMG013 TaxID=2822687 RepID=UPI001B3872BC|nr:hypothetical protein [Pseudoalteromonas sp. MMG013]MBQ4862518.1 hypothetical protein [Pseudoalteromonas sp. MMG013]
MWFRPSVVMKIIGSESDEYIEVFAAEFNINTDLHHKDEHRGLVWNGPELVHVQVNV